MSAGRPFIAETESIALDQSNTRVNFGISWLGGMRVSGSFEHAHGRLSIPGPALETATISVDVEAASVRTGITLRDKHLRGGDFLDVARHPLISFRSDDVRRRDGLLLVSGTLQLRGIERRVTAECELNTGVPSGSTVVALSARFRVSRRAHDVGAPRGARKLDPLFVVIGDDVLITTEVLVPAGHFLPRMLPALGR
jgi:polyisoprenoid-binding protein YceI